ncbi:hypothetical protein EF847_08150 [Actinobacteria bacterium YIM 96077]|uniref:WD40 repeat domain-containing protein n=2 Tax=Phytoactinopolyspora halophila TaxID=1981511 RepID=A0A329QF54_9ACTN|nr:hypothetical protein EF847_08150 [Actinobacteria bacterium YIM 96077]RAW10601.1 hypothetical protein DPM12_18855 [Phytoactinopolyspora halophila]
MFATAPDGRHAFAIFYDRDGVQVIDGGAWTVGHGDHDHYYTAPPRARELYPGGRPAHAVSHDGRAAIFYDDDGEYRLLDESEIAEGGPGHLLPVDAPHHGVAVPWYDDRTIVTRFGDTDPDETTLPPEVVIHNADGELVEEGFPECPDLHGGVALGSTVAFGCSDGVLVLDQHGGHVDGHKLDYPGDDERTGALLTADGLDVVVGNYSDDAYLVIDPVGHAVDAVAIPEPFSTFGVTGHDGGKLLGMSASGTLHVVDITSGDVESIGDVTAAYDEDAEWTEPTPQLATGPDGLVFVSDPEARRVHEIDLNAGEVRESYDVGGRPFHLTALGTG